MFSSSHRTSGRPEDAEQAPRTDAAPPADDTTGRNAEVTGTPDDAGTAEQPGRSSDESGDGEKP